MPRWWLTAATAAILPVVVGVEVTVAQVIVRSEAKAAEAPPASVSCAGWTTGEAAVCTCEDDAAGATIAATALDGDDEQQPRPWGITWDQGLHFLAPGGAFSLRTAFDVQNDSAGFVVDDEFENEFGGLDGDVEWRRARVFADGEFARHFRYKFQYDFAANNPPRLKDAWVEFDLPVVPIAFRGGRFRTPLTLEGYTSAKHTTFMERGLIGAFVPSRNTGFLLSGEAGPERHLMHWALAWVRPGDPSKEDSPDASGVTGRFTYKFNPREDVVAHAGFNYARRTVGGAEDTLRFSARPESHMAPRLVDTGDFRADATNTYVLEGVVSRESLSFQSEFAIVDVRGSSFIEAPVFWGGYVFVSYFITGESRPYVAGREAFGRIRPLKEFRGQSGGFGALEIAGRFSRLDLTSGDIDGGELNDFTFALNWYPTANARVMTNVIRARRSGIGALYIFQLRLQWHY